MSPDRYVVSCRKRDPRLAAGRSTHDRDLHTPKRAGTYALLRGEGETVEDTDPGERPGRRSGPGQHVEWREAQRTAEDAIAGRLAAPGPLVLYVHGFNTRPEEAAESTVRIQEHLDRNGVGARVVPFQWPSAGHLADYFPDQRAAGQFGSYALVNLLLSLQRRAEAPVVHCIAHSMGTYVVTRALSTITTLHLDAPLPAGRRPLAQVAYMQPDIDFDALCSGYRGPFDSPSYLEIADGYGATEMVERLTIYCTTNDMALFASLFKNRSKRLGAYGPGLEGVRDPKTIMETRVRQNVHVLNCDEWCVFDLSPNHSHSHFLECPRMMDDVAGVLRGMPAEANPARAATPAPRWYRLAAPRPRPRLLLAMAAWWRGLGSFLVNPTAVLLIKWKKRLQTYWRLVKRVLVIAAAGGTGFMAWLTQQRAWLAAAGVAAAAIVVYVLVWLRGRGIQKKQDKN
jgi:esterase/lipase superfamily enzyme